MRILLWSPKGAGSHYGGPGMSAYRLYAAREPGWAQVDLAHGFRDHPREPAVFRAEHLISTIFRGRGREAVLARGPRTLLYLRFLWNARVWLREHAAEYDVLHGLTGYAYTLGAALCAEQLGVPAAVKLAAYQRDLVSKNRLQVVIGHSQRRQRNLQRLSAVIAISTAIRDELVQYGVEERKIAMIPNGVNTGRFRPPADSKEKSAIRRDLGLEDRFTVLFAASILPRKRPDVVLAAITLLASRGLDLQLVLVGPVHDANFMQGMMTRAQAAGVEDRIVALGMRRDMPEVYRCADVFCLPSRIEGLSNAVLEAMATGLPIVAERISGNEDIVTARNGQLLSGDASEYAAALEMYYRDEAMRHEHGSFSRRIASEHYDTQLVLAAHRQLFGIMKNGGAPADASLTGPSAEGNVICTK